MEPFDIAGMIFLTDIVFSALTLLVGHLEKN